MINVRTMLVAIPVVALSISLPLGSEAQTVPSPYRYVEETQSAGLFAGYVIADRGDLDLGPHSSPILGATYTVRFAGPVSGEALLAGLPGRRTVYRQPEEGAADDAPLQAVGETTTLSALAQAGLKLHLTGPRTWRGIAPYGVLGVGFITDLAGSPDEEAEIPDAQRFEFGPSFAVTLGAGTDWFPSERLALRIEVRDFMWRLTTPAGLAAGGLEETAWTQNLAVMIGAALYF